MRPLDPDQIYRASVTAAVAGDDDLSAELLEALEPDELLAVAGYAVGQAAEMLTEQAGRADTTPEEWWAERVRAQVAHTG